MVGVIVITHGKLARALVSSAHFLVGKLQKTRGVSIWPKDTKERVRRRIKRKMSEVNDGDGVLILTDILGDPSTNLSLSFFENGKVEVVTGVNLPMLLTLSSYRRGKSLEEISRLAKKSGRRSIILAKKLLGLRQGANWKR